MEYREGALAFGKPKIHIIPKRPRDLGQNWIRTLEFDDDLVAPSSSRSPPVIKNDLPAKSLSQWRKSKRNPR